jgi:F-box and WD-40 domain protein 1/11
MKNPLSILARGLLYARGGGGFLSDGGDPQNPKIQRQDVANGLYGTLNELGTQLSGYTRNSVTPTEVPINFVSVLPVEIILQILSFLDVQSISRISACSKALNTLSSDNSLWHALYFMRCEWREPPNVPLQESAPSVRLRHQNRRSSLPNVMMAAASPPSTPGSVNVMSHAQLPSPPASPVSPSMPCMNSAEGRGTLVLEDPGYLSSISAVLDWRYHYRNRLILERNWSRQMPIQRTLHGHSDSVYCIQFDRTRLISGSRDQTVKIWNLISGKVVQTLKGHSGSVLCLQYDQHLLLTGSSDATLIGWAMPSGTRLFVLSGHLAGVLDVAFNERWITSCSKDASIKVWRRPLPDSLEANSVPKLTHTLNGHRAAVNAIQLRDNLLVSASGDYLLKVWDVSTGKHVRDLLGHTRGIACVAFDGRLVVSGSNDQTIRLWDVHTGQCLKSVHGHADLVRTLAMDSRRGIVVSGSYDQSVRIWDFSKDIKAAQVLIEGRTQNGTSSTTENTAPLILESASPPTQNDGGPHAEDAANNARVREVHAFTKSHSSWVFNVALSSTHLVSASQDQTIVIYDYSRGVDTRWIQ